MSKGDLHGLERIQGFQFSQQHQCIEHHIIGSENIGYHHGLEHYFSLNLAIEYKSGYVNHGKQMVHLQLG